MKHLSLIGFVMVVAIFVGGGFALAGSAQEDECEIPPKLLKTRPNPEGEPTPIKLAITILDVTDIDEAKQTFTTDFFVVVRWKDPRLSKEALGYSLEGCLFDFYDIWNPWLLLMNKRNIDLTFEDFGRVDSQGNVSFARRGTGNLTAKYELSDFPFDTQTLPVEISSIRYSPEELKLVYNEKESGMFEEISLAGWKIREGKASTRSTYIPSEDVYRPHFEYNLIATREIGYYFWKILIPLTLLVAMAWAVFWINPIHFGPQIAISTASVFSLIAFLFSLGALLPKVSYLTRLDEFVLGCTVMVFCALGETIIASRFAMRGRENIARNIDKVTRLVYPVLFLLLIIFTLVI